MSVTGVYLYDTQREEIKFLMELYQKQRDAEIFGPGVRGRHPDYKMVTDDEVIRMAIDELYEKEQKALKDARREEYDRLYITDERALLFPQIQETC